MNFATIHSQTSARIRAILKPPMAKLRPAYLYVIGELQIANRRQCRFQPRKGPGMITKPYASVLQGVRTRLSATGCRNGRGST